MKAAFFRQHGGPDVMEYGGMPDPRLEGDVLVKLQFAAMNRVDKWIRDGWPGIKLSLPHIPGSDGAGTVEVGAKLFKKAIASSSIQILDAANASFVAPVKTIFAYAGIFWVKPRTARMQNL